jgi:hypothetical protein
MISDLPFLPVGSATGWDSNPGKEPRIEWMESD